MIMCSRMSQQSKTCSARSAKNKELTLKERTGPVLIGGLSWIEMGALHRTHGRQKCTN